MRESRGCGGEERRNSGPFVGRRQRRQSLSADKMKKKKPKKPEVALVQHRRKHMATCVCVRNGGLHRTLGDHHTPRSLFSPEIPKEDKQTTSHTHMHMHTDTHTRKRAQVCSLKRTHTQTYTQWV